MADAASRFRSLTRGGRILAFFALIALLVAAAFSVGDVERLRALTNQAQRDHATHKAAVVIWTHLPHLRKR